MIKKFTGEYLKQINKDLLVLQKFFNEENLKSILLEYQSLIKELFHLENTLSFLGIKEYNEDILAWDAIVNVLSQAEWDKKILIIFDFDLIFGLILNLLGEKKIPQRRHITEFEEGVLIYILCKLISPIWKIIKVKLHKVNLKINEIPKQINPQYILSFYLKAKEIMGNIYLVLSKDICELIIKQIHKPKEIFELEDSYIYKNLDLSLSFVLATGKLKLATLRNLEVGDIILLNNIKKDKAWVYIEGINKFEAELLKEEDKLKVRLL
jgi:flagellar motor switch protein FliM